MVAAKVEAGRLKTQLQSRQSASRRGTALSLSRNPPGDYDHPSEDSSLLPQPWMFPPMLRITAEKRPLCDGLRRRDVLRVGAASLQGLLQARTQGRVRAKSVILFVLEGGPAHQDLWDMKPDAPLGVRSEFRPIATTVPGLLFCEHLPMLAQQAHHLTLAARSTTRVEQTGRECARSLKQGCLTTYDLPQFPQNPRFGTKWDDFSASCAQPSGVAYGVNEFVRG